MNNPAPEENQLNIELPEELAEGYYVNLALIAHSPSEFVMDFIRILPGIPKAKVKSRVVMTPDHAYRLMLALQDNIQKFEENTSFQLYFNNARIRRLAPPAEHSY
jgi:hypothetical protein